MGSDDLRAAVETLEAAPRPRPLVFYAAGPNIASQWREFFPDIPVVVLDRLEAPET